MPRGLRNLPLVKGDEEWRPSEPRGDCLSMCDSIQLTRRQFDAIATPPVVRVVGRLRVCCASQMFQKLEFPGQWEHPPVVSGSRSPSRRQGHALARVSSSGSVLFGGHGVSSCRGL